MKMFRCFSLHLSSSITFILHKFAILYLYLNIRFFDVLSWLIAWSHTHAHVHITTATFNATVIIIGVFYLKCFITEKMIFFVKRWIFGCYLQTDLAGLVNGKFIYLVCLWLHKRSAFLEKRMAGWRCEWNVFLCWWRYPIYTPDDRIALLVCVCGWRLSFLADDDEEDEEEDYDYDDDGIGFGGNGSYLMVWMYLLNLIITQRLGEKAMKTTPGWMCPECVRACVLWCGKCNRCLKGVKGSFCLQAMFGLAQSKWRQILNDDWCYLAAFCLTSNLTLTLWCLRRPFYWFFPDCHIYRLIYRLEDKNEKNFSTKFLFFT